MDNEYRIFYVGEELEMRVKLFPILLDYYKNDSRAEFETRRLINMYTKKELKAIEDFA